VLVFRDVTIRREDERRLRKMQKELERLAHTDALTGLYNRRIFMQRLEEEVERVRRHGKALSVLIFDLDFFKSINDTYGHDTGDIVLVAISRVTTEVKRMSDVAARLGGEEFALLLPETDQQGAVQLAQRLRTSIEKHIYLSTSGSPVKVTASIGVATATKAEQEVDKLLSLADKQLYRAKHNGRNRVCSTMV
jgi:diguanylate cyclase (GGDEF)-like protein